MLAVSVLAHLLHENRYLLEEIVQYTQGFIRDTFYTCEPQNTRNTIYSVCKFALKQLAQLLKTASSCDSYFHFLYALASFPAAQGVEKSVLECVYKCVAEVCSSEPAMYSLCSRELAKLGLLLYDSTGNAQLHAIVAEYILSTAEYVTAMCLAEQVMGTTPERAANNAKEKLLSILVVILHDTPAASGATATDHIASQASRAQLRRKAMDQLTISEDHNAVLMYLCDKNYYYSTWIALDFIKEGVTDKGIALLQSIVSGNLQLFVQEAMALSATNIQAQVSALSNCTYMVALSNQATLTHAAPVLF
jgi:hypothetical protein